MSTKLTYVIKYVANMDDAVAFFRDTLALELKFQSPQWSEFSTGDTTLALHIASEKNPAGAVQVGFGVADVDEFYARTSERGVQFTAAPTVMHGAKIARFLDSERSECSVGS